MKETYSNSITVNQSPAAVFDFLSIPSNHPTFVPNLLELETDPPGQPWEIGVEATSKHKFMHGTVNGTSTMIERTPDTSIVLNIQGAIATVLVNWLLKPVSDGTEVTMSFTLERSMTLRILQALGIGDIEKEQKVMLSALKEKLDAKNQS